MSEEDIELRVCNVCDAPLPCEEKKLNLFNYSNETCDDCVNLKVKG